MGLLNPLYDAVSWVLLQFHNLWDFLFSSSTSWVLAIVCLVIVIRIMLLPLFARQIRAQRGLQELQPEMRKIQEKYKNDRQKQAEELQKLYRERGVNPLSSCLPILIQSPFFFALYHVLLLSSRGQEVGVLTAADVAGVKAATLFGAPLWGTFTTAATTPDPTATRIVSLVLIVLMTSTTFITQRQLIVKNVAPGPNPFQQQQKILLYVFPVMFAVFGINFPIGVLIYWFTTNLWTMGQQFYVIRRNPTPGSPAWDELQARKAAKEKAAAEKATATADGLPAAGGGTAAATSKHDASGESTSSGTASGGSSGGSASAKPGRQQPKRTSRAQRAGPPKKR